MSKLHTYLEAIKNRQLPYDAEVIADAIEQLKEYGSPRTIKELMMSRNVDGYSVDDLMDVILALTPELKKGAGLSGGGYAYYPNKTLTVWETSDGGKVRGKLLDIMVNYMFQDADEAAEMLTMEPDYAMEELLIGGGKDQAGYEGSRMRGDRYSKPQSQTYELHIWPLKKDRNHTPTPISKSTIDSIKKQIAMKFEGNGSIKAETHKQYPEIWMIKFKAPKIENNYKAMDSFEKQFEPIVKSAVGKKAFENIKFEIDSAGE
jgi:hypothetical protein